MRIKQALTYSQYQIHKSKAKHRANRLRRLQKVSRRRNRRTR